MKRLFAVSALVAVVSANLSLQAIAVYRECCRVSIAGQPGCSQCQPRQRAGVAASRPCCEPIQNQTVPKPAFTVPPQTRADDLHFDAYLPAAAVALLELRPVEYLPHAYAARLPEVSDILSFHSRLNI